MCLRRAGLAAFSLAGVLPLACVLAGCEDRPRSNPLDPGNPATGGGPSGFGALAAHESVRLAWRAAPVGTTLLGFFLERRTLPSTVFSAVGDILPPTSTGAFDAGLANDSTYEYRLSYVTVDSTIAGRSALSTASPGPELIWVSDPGADEIARMTPDGRNRFLTISGALTVNRLAVDPSDGALWATEPLDGRIKIFDTDGSPLAVFGGPVQPNAIAVDALSGTAWVCDEFANVAQRFDRSGGVQATTAVLGQPSDVAPTGAGDVWIVDQGGDTGPGQVLRVTASGAALTTLPVGSDPRRVAVDLLDGSIWVSRFDAGEIQHLSPTGAELHRIGGLQGPYAIDIDEFRNIVWVGLDGANAVLALNRGTGATIRTVTGIARPRGVAVVDRTGEVWIASISEGEVVRLASDGTVLGRIGGFEAPFDVRVDPGPRP
ncbi:MAG: hypothetical protein ACREOU_15120 [Candidatus Eiseniibacteriota bacterium]